MKIDKPTYYQLLGLLTIAENKNKRLKEIERSIAELLDQEPEMEGYYGHISDSVWSQMYSADQLLNKLDIEVEEDE